MITGWKSVQDQGKTLGAVLQVLSLCLWHGYSPRECYGNVQINLPGYNFVSSAELRELFGVMVRENWKHKVMVIDEISRVYPARWWADKTRTEELLTVWQDEKCFHQFIYTTHVGNSVDVLVRQATQIICVPRYRKLWDLLEVEVINSLDLEVARVEVARVSRYFPLYDRWAIVV